MTARSWRRRHYDVPQCRWIRYSPTCKTSHGIFAGLVAYLFNISRSGVKTQGDFWGLFQQTRRKRRAMCCLHSRQPVKRQKIWIFIEQFMFDGDRYWLLSKMLFVCSSYLPRAGYTPRTSHLPPFAEEHILRSSSSCRIIHYTYCLQLSAFKIFTIPIFTKRTFLEKFYIQGYSKVPPGFPNSTAQ